MQDSRKRLLILGILVVIVASLYAVLTSYQSKELKVSFLDVGQGDAIFIQAPNGRQMLIDGGRDGIVMAELKRVMPFGDRNIDVMLATHPDADHIGGLDDVFSRYEIAAFIEPGVKSDTKTYDGLMSARESEGAAYILGTRGMTIMLDERSGVSFKILYPNVDVTDWETNDASIVGLLTYGQDSFLLTGDAPIKTELSLTQISPKDIDVDILKLGHHGSRTSSSQTFLKATSPEMAIISAGKNNSYDHPHKEVTSLLNYLSIPYLNTANEGTITFVSRGEGIKKK